MAYLVDTDILIDITKGSAGAIQYLRSLKDPWSISIITAMELIVGGRNKEEAARIDNFL